MRSLLVCVAAVALAGCTGVDTAPSVSPSPTVTQSQNASAGASQPAVLDGAVVYGRSAGADLAFFRSAFDGSGELELAPADCAACGRLSPDGTQLMFAIPVEGGLATATATTDGGDYTIVDKPEGLNVVPGAWAPDNSEVVLDGWSDTEASLTGTYRMNADGTELAQIVPSPDGRHYIPISYSPDGSKILIFREGGEATEASHAGDLFVASRDGSGLRQLNPDSITVLTFDITGINPASWSPDGKQVAFGAFSGDPQQGVSAVFTASVDGGQAERLTDWGQWQPYARWSPSGDWIAYGGVVAPDRYLAIVRPDGSEQTMLSSPADNACCAEWSVDSMWLIHQRGEVEVVSDLWLTNLEGDTVQVTHTPGQYVVLGSAP